VIFTAGQVSAQLPLTSHPAAKFRIFDWLASIAVLGTIQALLCLTLPSTCACKWLLLHSHGLSVVASICHVPHFRPSCWFVYFQKMALGAV